MGESSGMDMSSRDVISSG